VLARSLVESRQRGVDRTGVCAPLFDSMVLIPQTIFPHEFDQVARIIA
jgi:hypothetical protein